MQIHSKLMAKFLIYSVILLCVSCGTSRWHSVEQEYAEPYAYLSDGAYVSGEYVRLASVVSVDGIAVDQTGNSIVKVSPGKHAIKIVCDEAKGSFNTKDLKGVARVLSFEFEVQRNYKVFCVPYTHWWVQDLDNGKVVAGQSP